MAALTALVLLAGYFALGLFVSVLVLAIKIHMEDRRHLRPFDWDIDEDFARLLRERAMRGRA